MHKAGLLTRSGSAPSRLRQASGNWLRNPFYSFRSRNSQQWVLLQILTAFPFHPSHASRRKAFGTLLHAQK